MKNPFTKKPDPAAQVLQGFLSSATWNDKLRVAAATKTGGELELRMRQVEGGAFRFSLWLCVPGDDAGLRLMPAPETSSVLRKCPTTGGGWAPTENRPLTGNRAPSHAEKKSSPGIC